MPSQDGGPALADTSPYPGDRNQRLPNDGFTNVSKRGRMAGWHETVINTANWWLVNLCRAETLSTYAKEIHLIQLREILKLLTRWEGISFGGSLYVCTSCGEYREKPIDYFVAGNSRAFRLIQYMNSVCLKEFLIILDVFFNNNFYLSSTPQALRKPMSLWGIVYKDFWVKDEVEVLRREKVRGVVKNLGVNQSPHSSSKRWVKRVRLDRSKGPQPTSPDPAHHPDTWKWQILLY